MSQSRKESSLQASVLDSLLVFGLVIIVGSICVIVLLRDMDRNWSALGGALEKIPGTEGSKKPGSR